MIYHYTYYTCVVTVGFTRRNISQCTGWIKPRFSVYSAYGDTFTCLLYLYFYFYLNALTQTIVTSNSAV